MTDSPSTPPTKYTDRSDLVLRRKMTVVNTTSQWEWEKGDRSCSVNGTEFRYYSEYNLLTFRDTRVHINRWTDNQGKIGIGAVLLIFAFPNALPLVLILILVFAFCALFPFVTGVVNSRVLPSHSDCIRAAIKELNIPDDAILSQDASQGSPKLQISVERDYHETPINKYTK